MTNCTDTLEQEYYGWAGNSIFIFAQLLQIFHTFKEKKTGEISYGLEIMWIIGNAFYTTFGYIDNSLSMFAGNFISLGLSIIQIIQKLYYDKKNKNKNNDLYHRIAAYEYEPLLN